MPGLAALLNPVGWIIVSEVNFVMLADAHELQPIVALLRVCLVRSLAEKPKLGELQMDWLRSEA